MALARPPDFASRRFRQREQSPISRRVWLVSSKPPSLADLELNLLDAPAIDADQVVVVFVPLGVLADQLTATRVERLDEAAFLEELGVRYTVAPDTADASTP